MTHNLIAKCGPEAAAIAYHVVYLTGAPAAGKSSFTRALSKLVSPLAVFEYGEQLTNHLNEQRLLGVSQATVREKSASIVTARDIEELDERLISFVDSTRAHSHVIIDSHAVTRESYGFRITPFSLAKWHRLGATMIVGLFTPPAVTLERIHERPDGRRAVSEWEAGFHTALQAGVAQTYAVSLGRPLYLYDSSAQLDTIAVDVARRMGSAGSSSSPELPVDA